MFTELYHSVSRFLVDHLHLTFLKIWQVVDNIEFMYAIVNLGRISYILHNVSGENEGQKCWLQDLLSLSFFFFFFKKVLIHCVVSSRKQNLWHRCPNKNCFSMSAFPFFFFFFAVLIHALKGTSRVCRLQLIEDS